MGQLENHCEKCENEVGEVKVLQPDERDDFQGLTLQQGEEPSARSGYAKDSSNNYEYRSEGPGHRVFVRQVSFGSGGTRPFGFLTKLIIAALILFFIFVALPIALVLMVVFSLIWWLVRR
jgi:hypothetical protein